MMIVRSLLALTLLVAVTVGGCPPMEETMGDPNMSTGMDTDDSSANGGASGGASGGSSGSGGSGGSTGSGDSDGTDDETVTPDPNEMVGPQPPSDDEDDMEASTTQTLRVFVTFFDTGGPASGAFVTVRTTEVPFETLCTETAGFDGQAICIELPLGPVQVTATATDNDGFPISGSTQLIISDGALPETANITLFP